jgi:hypothetical protein
MIGRIFLAGALTLAISAPALAFHCPADVKAIDTAMSKVSLNASQSSEVKQLRDEGESLHKSGSHTEAQLALAKAMRIMLTNL